MILCSVLIPRTTDVVVEATPTTKQYLTATKQEVNATNLDKLKNQFIIETGTNDYVAIDATSLATASIAPQVETATKATYLCYLPSSSLGKMQFMFSIYYNSTGPTGIQVGNSDLINLEKLPPDVTSGNIAQS